MASSISSKLDDWFAVDLRSLAAFRIALASVLLYDLIDRARDLRAHYTDAGLLPADLLEQVAGSGIRFSLHYQLSSSEWAIGLLFGLSWLAATALLFGHRTRVASFVCWFLLASVQVRNPYLASMGGDALLRVLLTWGLLLPLGARFSLDALRSPELHDHPNRSRSIPGAALLLQVCLMYWVTGLKKNGEAWLDGSAVHYALHMDYWATPVGVAVREQTWALPLLTHATRYFELLGPFLAFSPFFTVPLRMVTIVLFAAFHFSLAIALDIGLFPLVSMVGWFAFLPGCFWDRVLPSSADAADAEEEAAEEEVQEGERLRPLTPLVAQLAAALLLAYVLSSLAIQVGWLDARIPAPVTRLASALRVQQYWSMFSPNPPVMDFWIVATGTQRSGAKVDLFREAPPSHAKPDDIAATLPSFRWRLYFSSLLTVRPEDPRHAPTYEGLARHLCRSWNESHEGEEQIRDVTVEVVIEFTRATFEEEPGVALLYEAPCEQRQVLPDPV